MLSRIFWVGIAGLALVTGMVLQDGDRFFDWDVERDVSRQVERSIEADVDRAIDRSMDGAEVVDAEGRAIDVPPQMKRAFATAVAGLVEAETDLALLRIRDGSNEERQAATLRRDQARAELDRLKAQIQAREQRPVIERQVRDQIREEIREDIRSSVQDAVGN